MIAVSHETAGLSLALPFEPAAASTARHRVADLLVRAGVSRRSTEDAATVVYELVMNGVAHGRPQPPHLIAVEVSIHGPELLIVVRDDGLEGLVEAQHPTLDHPCGRGLAMVDALASSWAVERNGGTTVSARVPLSS